jgi:hypothetical protein
VDGVLLCGSCKKEAEKRRCLICLRVLDVPGEPDSLDCGGDCQGCMDEIEGGIEAYHSNEGLT